MARTVGGFAFPLFRSKSQQASRQAVESREVPDICALYDHIVRVVSPFRELLVVITSYSMKQLALPHVLP